MVHQSHLKNLARYFARAINLAERFLETAVGLILKGQGYERVALDSLGRFPL